MNDVDLRERLAVNAPLTRDQCDFLLSLLSSPRVIARGDVVQIDPAHDPDKLGGLLLVADVVESNRLLGYFPDWGMQRNGIIPVSVSLARVKHTGGTAQWPLEPFAHAGNTGG